MVSYLLNLSIIWLLSLLCFDIFLRRETYHGYNRAYLLLTMAAGMFMPLYARPSFAATSVTQRPLHRVDAARTAIADTITPQQSVSWIALLEWLYIAGAAVSLLWLLREVIALVRYYRSGAKTKQGRYTIVETGRSHGPFSIGRILFISSLADYSAEQWQIVLRHEQQHSMLLHLADMIVIQATQIVFWFHPLVYLYRRRLLLVHEYQADAATAMQPLQYGNFLIEQTLLQAGPLPAHSFNRSPIKNRLRMLSKNASSTWARLKYWLTVPALAICLICCAKAKEYNSYPRKKEGNKITYKGNVLELSAPRYDTILMIDPATGKENQTIITMDPRPVSLNGQPIVDEENADKKPEYKGTGPDLATTVFNYIMPDMEKLPDGKYTVAVFNIIVDDQGKLAYYEVSDIADHAQQFTIGETNGKPSITADTIEIKPSTVADKKAQQAIAQKIDRYLANENILFSPAMSKGKPVPCNISGGFRYDKTIVVNNHKATITEKKN